MWQNHTAKSEINLTFTTEKAIKLQSLFVCVHAHTSENHKIKLKCFQALQILNISIYIIGYLSTTWCHTNNWLTIPLVNCIIFCKVKINYNKQKTTKKQACIC